MTPDRDDRARVWLFSYGSLQRLSVQIATFGREVHQQPDVLTGYALVPIELDDPTTVAATGTTHHYILRYTGNALDEVSGSALSITNADLAKADAYEPPEYRRVAVHLASGRDAFVYVESRDAGLNHVPE